MIYNQNFIEIDKVRDIRPLVRSKCDLSLQDKLFIEQEVSSKLDDAQDFTGNNRQLGGIQLQDTADELEDRFGQRLGLGAGRIVLELSEDCVLKVSKQANPAQNKSEVLSYTEKLTKAQKKMFAPVVNWDGDYRWLTMIKTDRKPDDEEFFRAAKKIVLQHGIDLIDFQQRNFGVIDGKTVVIDYGSGTNFIDEVPTWDSRQEGWDSIKNRMEFN